MQIEYIRLFHMAASLGSISKAAAVSHISQPALSQQIQKLEQDLGYKLMDRSNKGVELTKAGEIVEKYAELYTGLFENMMEDLAELRTKKATVRIAASPVVGIYGLPCTMFQVKSTFPDYSFHQVTRPSVEVESAVLQGESDIGFIIGEPENTGLFRKKVFSDRLLLVSSADYEVEPKLNLDGVKRYPLVLQSAKSSLFTQLQKYLAEKDISFDDYNVLFNLDTAESVKSSVISSHGLAFLPYLAIKKELYLKQLREIELTDFDMYYDVYIIYHKKESANDMLYQIASYFSNIVSETFC